MGFIEKVLINVAHTNSIILGDTNFNVNDNNVGYLIVHPFHDNYALTACDDFIIGPDRCTYVNEALGHSSCIDHFFVSAAVRSAIKCISIVDSTVNNWRPAASSP